jgi:hypothetical protein
MGGKDYRRGKCKQQNAEKQESEIHNLELLPIGNFFTFRLKFYSISVVEVKKNDRIIVMYQTSTMFDTLQWVEKQ